MKTFCLGFVFSLDETSVILIKKDGKRFPWMKGLLNGVGGLIESNEAPAKAMGRECCEETGLVIYDNEWEMQSDLICSEGRVIVFKANIHLDDMVVAAKTGRMKNEPVAVYEPGWVTELNALKNVPLLLALCKDTTLIKPVRLLDKEWAKVPITAGP